MTIQFSSTELERIKQEEERVICRALRDSNYPKITKDDLGIFKGLIEDLFPGVEVDRLLHEELEKTLVQCCKDSCLQPEASFLLKIIQLEELLPIRHSIFILGNAAVGKSAVWKTLVDARRRMKPKEKLLYQIINPKAVTTRELFGYIQPSTREWKDGILSTVMRDFAAIQNTHDKWIILDGDVDTLWIESLNTVMDDNKVLTLASNERIPLLPHMRLIFEIGSLQYASPATVSRAGIIYVNETDVGWGPFYQSWVDSFDLNPLFNQAKQIKTIDGDTEYKASSVITSQLTVLSSKYIAPCVEWIKRGVYKTIVPTNDISLVQSMTRIISSLLENYVTTPAYKTNTQNAINNLMNNTTDNKENKDYSKDVIEYFMIFACVWAVGGLLCKDNGIDHRLNFAKNWKLEFAKGITFPATQDDQVTIFDYYVELDESGMPSWALWADRVRPYEHDPDLSVKQIHVETVDSYRLHYLITNLIKAGHPTMLAGPAGLGKSVLFKSKLNEFVEKLNYQQAVISMNYYTTSAQLQMIMESYLFKNGKKYGPKNNKKLIYQVDDLNMSQVDIYGTQQPVTFLRQQQDWHFWFDRDKLQVKEVENIQFVATMNPYAGSFEINQQYQWHFTTFSIELPNVKILKQIYGSIFKAHLQTDPKFVAVRKLGDSIIQTLLDFHTKIVDQFPPTAVKFHYQFNLRDITNIVDNMMKVKAEHLKGYEQFVQLLNHECDRVYMDRLVDVPDREKYKKLQSEMITKNLTTVNIVEQPTNQGTGRPKSGANAAQVTQINVNIKDVFDNYNIFSNFSLGVGEGSYCQVASQDRLQQLVNEALFNHNQEKAEMNLVLFNDAMEHVCKISRIISTADALLVGVGGSGKQSLAKLAAYINAYDVFQITISANYNIDSFKEDIQKLYENTGLKGNPTMFLFTDQQIVTEEFLVCINDILASGQIAGLFPPDREEEIINAMRNKCKEQGLVDTDENCKSVFIQKVKENLHIVLGFSPNEEFKARCRKFPALVTCTTIDWFQPWPHEALKSVAKNFLLNRDKEKPRKYSDVDIDISEKQINNIAQFMADAHTIVEKDIAVQFQKDLRRKAYTTPKSFLELISLYLKLLYEKTSQIKSRINKLETGNATLIKTEEEVQVLKKQLEVQKIEANKAKQEVEQLLVGLNEKNKITSEEKAKATVKQKEAASIEANVKAAKAQADKENEEAQPVLKAALAALETLDKPSLDEMSKYSNPPQNIVILMQGVQYLLAEPGVIKSDTSWKAAQLIMKNGAQFLITLKNFDGKNINHVNKQAVQNLLDTKADVFDTQAMLKKSKAAGGLCEWLKNIIKYNTVFLKVDPLEKESLRLKGEADKAQAVADAAKAVVDKLDGELRVLQAEFDKANKQKDAVVRKQEEMEYSLELANKLVNGLSSEKVRWRNQVSQLKEEEQTLIGDVLITSAFISYAGPFTKRYRMELIQKMIERSKELGIPMLEEIKPLKMLADDATIATWNNNALPNDEVSLENAAIFTACSRWPLIIDPQLQGINWIKKTEGAQLKILRFNQANWLKQVEKALSDGTPVLIENIGESIDAVLNPVLARAIIQKPGNKKAIKLGENEVEYNDNFRIYFQTKLPNPHYTPETQAQTTLINFTVTEEGLEDQLLADVVGVERADLEEKKQELIQQQNNFKITLQQLEKDLLDRLSNVGDNIIQDTKLIANLEQTKSTSTEIEEKVKIARITEQDIDTARSAYRPIAARSSMLYFLLNSLAIIDHFYQYSLSAFKVVFFRAIHNAEQSEELATRIEVLKEAITSAIYKYANRGLFERHRLIFNSQLAFNILKKEGRLPQDEFSYLINGSAEPGSDNPLSDCILPYYWNCVTALSRLPAFSNLVSDINGSAKRWREWIQDEQPENQPLPQDWKNKTPLQQLCIIRALRPDRLLTAMRRFIATSVSERFIEPIPFNFPEIYADMSRSEPLFFILSPGVDPVKDVEALGLKKGFTVENGKFKSVSLGQGQERNAENAIVNMSKQGGWVLLQNIHLMSKWQLILEKMMDEYCTDAAHVDFRLFISAEPNPNPAVAAVLPGIVQMCLKTTNEPPTGMKANMNRALNQLSADTFEMCQNKTNEFKSMLYGLVFFHAALLERRKFGSIGWNNVYNFTNGDLLICKDVLYNYLEANPKIPWDDLRYMFTDIFYGGHIGDDLDRRYIKTFALDIFNEQLFEDGKFLCPEFPAPSPMTYQEYREYTNANLPDDSPKMFGLHPNAEITYLTTQSVNLFNNLMLLQPAGAIGGGGDSSKSKEEIVMNKVETLLTQIPQEDYMIQDLNDRNPDAQPFNSVCIQECARMNTLVQTMRSSLLELQLGLKGELSMSDAMERLMDALFVDRIPETWEKHAYPSLKKLPLWMNDLEFRIKQLNDWSNDLSLPKVVWLSHLFNPQSFLRAVLQTTARAQKLALDTMALQIEILKKELADMTSPMRDGAAIYGLFMDGARWDKKSNSIRDSILKDLYPQLPPIALKAVPLDKAEYKDTYECPVYINRNRNRETYVWSFNVKTREPTSKWIMAGVAMLLANDQ